jgi:hypothetical protein
MCNLLDSSFGQQRNSNGGNVYVTNTDVFWLGNSMEILLFDTCTNCLVYAVYELIYEDKSKVVCVLQHQAIKTSGTV